MSSFEQEASISEAAAIERKYIFFIVLSYVVDFGYVCFYPAGAWTRRVPCPPPQPFECQFITMRLLLYYLPSLLAVVAVFHFHRLVAVSYKISVFAFRAIVSRVEAYEYAAIDFQCIRTLAIFRYIEHA